MIAMYKEFTFLQLWRRLFGNSSKYGLGILLMKVGGLLVLPLYWDKLTSEEYGIIGISQVMGLVLTPLLSLGLQESVQRYYLEWKQGEREKYLGAIWLFSTCISLLLCIIFNFAGPAIFSRFFINVEFDPYLRISLWTLFFSNFSVFSIALFRIREDIVKYNLVSMGNFLTQVIFILATLYGYDMGLKGFFLGLLGSSMLWAIVHIFYFLKSSNLSFSFPKDAFKFSIYIMLASLFEGSAFVFDRYFLDKHLGLAAIGIYAVAMQIAGGYNVVNFVFKTSWIPFLYRVVNDREDSPRILGLFSTYGLAVLAIPALALSLFAEELFRIIDNPAYSAVSVYVPIFVLGYFCSSIGTLMGRGFDLAKANHMAPLVPIITFVCGFFLSAALIPKYGIWGGGVAFVLIALIRSLVQIYLAAKAYPRPFYWKKLSGLAVAIVVGYSAGILVSGHSLEVSILLKLLILKVTSVVIIRVALGGELFYKFCFSLLNSAKGMARF